MPSLNIIEKKHSFDEIEEIDSRESEEILNNQNYFVKCRSFEDLQEAYRNNIEGKFEASELISIGKKLFKELKINYEVGTPVRFFIGKNEDNKKVFYTRVDKIDGQDLNARESLDDIADKVQELYVDLSNYFIGKLRGEEFFLTDICNLSQYVYGKKLSKTDCENQIYLVDADIYMDNRAKSLLTVVYWLSRYLSAAEQKLRIRNSLARNNIENFIGEYEERFPKLDKKNQQRLSEIKKFLSGEKFGDEILPAIPTFEGE